MPTRNNTHASIPQADRDEWLTEFELVDLLESKRKGRSLREFALMLDVSNTFLGDVLRRMKSPGDKVPHMIGYEEVKLYRPIHPTTREKK